MSGGIRLPLRSASTLDLPSLDNRNGNSGSWVLNCAARERALRRNQPPGACVDRQRALTDVWQIAASGPKGAIGQRLLPAMAPSARSNYQFNCANDVIDPETEHGACRKQEKYCDLLPKAHHEHDRAYH
jgi:hypothetical protein